ncbi:Neprilysin-4, partial [Podila verticillata]
ISSVGRKPLQEDILKLVEIFPVSDSDLATKSTVVPASSNTDKRTLATTLAYFASHDIDTPLHLSPTTDVKNPDKTILAIDENGLGLNFKGNYADARITSVYQTTIASMFNLVLGDGPQNSTSATVPASWTEVAKDVYAFEKSLAEIGSSPEEMMDPLLTYNPMNVSQIAALAPSVDWPWFLEKALPPGMQVPEPLTVSSKDYLSKLEALFQKTSPKTMQNYFAWTMIRKKQESLDSAYQQPMKDLEQTLSGISAATLDDRSNKCVKFVNGNVGEIAGHYFVEKVFGDRGRKEVESIIAHLQSMYTKSFPKYEWLDKSTLQGALTKMATMDVK